MARQFNGTSDRLTSTANALFRPDLGSWFVVMRVKRSVTTATEVPMCSGNASAVAVGWTFIFGASGLVAFRVGDGTNTARTDFAAGLTDTASWHTLIAVVDRTSNTIKCYLDGSLTGFAPNGTDSLASIGTINQGVELSVASTSTPFGWLTGQVAQIAIVKGRVPTAGEIANLGAGGDPAIVLQGSANLVTFPLTTTSLAETSTAGSVSNLVATGTTSSTDPTPALVNALSYVVSFAPTSVNTGVATTATFALRGGTTLSSSLVITPVDDTAGSWSAGTLTIANGSTSGTLTRTPSAIGTHTITTSHTGGGFTGGDPTGTFAATSAGALTAGTATAGSTTATTAAATATEASGGTAPYTKQWQRSTTSGTGFANVSGQTSLTLADTGLSPSTAYFYRLVYTDSASATVTSNEITETTTAGTTILPSNLWDNGYSGSTVTDNGAAYYPCDPVSVLALQTTATSLAVLVHRNGSVASAGTIYARIPGYDGATFNTASVLGDTSVTIDVTALPGYSAGSKVVEITSGTEGYISGSPVGTYLKSFAATGDASPTILAPSVGSGRMVVYGDSIASGSAALTVAASPAYGTLGWAALVKVYLGGRGKLVNVARGSRTLALDVTNGTTATSFAAFLVARQSGNSGVRRYWIEIGTNDFGAGTSASAFATNYALLVDAIFAADSAALIFLQSPTLRGVETANAGGSTLTNYRDAIKAIAATRSFCRYVDGSKVVPASRVSGYPTGDYLHPDTTGHAMMAGNFTAAIDPPQPTLSYSLDFGTAAPVAGQRYLVTARIPVGTTLASDVTVTLAGTNLTYSATSGGSLATPGTLTISAASGTGSAYWSPTAAGSVAPSATNGGSLANPTISALTATAAPPVATSYSVVGIPSAPVVGQSYAVTAILNGPASALGVITPTPASGITWGSAISIAAGANSGATTVTFTAGAYTPAFTHTGLGFSGDPTLSSVTATAGGTAAASYTVVGIPSTPIVNTSYTIAVVLDNPASASGVVTFGAQSGITWGGTVTLAQGAVSGTTTVTFTAAGSYTPTATHSGLGFSGNPTLPSVTAVLASSGGTAPTAQEVADAVLAKLLSNTNGIPADLARIGGDATAAANAKEDFLANPATQTAAVVAGVTTATVNALGVLLLDKGAVADTPAPTTTTFSATGAGLTAGSGGYRGMNVVFQDASGNVKRTVTSHSVVGSRHDFVIDSANPLPTAPGVGDTFILG